MDGKKFGHKVRDLRKAKGVTREEFCGDEVELSIRQLARIESGQSIPTLAKVEYIAKRLGVTVGSLTDGDSLELPKRYKELKYLILRNPTYLDKERIELREEQFDEIFENYYDNLPEVEQVLIDIIQSRFEVLNSGDGNFGLGLLSDYFEQLRKKKNYQANDLILIDLYLMCGTVSRFDPNIFDIEVYEQFVKNLFQSAKNLEIDELFLLNKLILNICAVDIWLGNYDRLEKLLDYCHEHILKSQDLQRMPIYFMYRWEQSLHKGEENLAEKYYQQAILFAEMIQDDYLIKKLHKEWEARD